MTNKGLLLGASVVLPLVLACVTPEPSLPSPPLSPTRTISTAVPPPKRIKGEEVSFHFDRGLFRLEGTLTLPERAEGERVPVVVLVHGSGPMSRDGLMPGQLGLGFGFEIPVYKQIADALAGRGFAVYRYDKRTCGQFNDCVETGISSIPYAMLEVEFAAGEYVRDAEAAIDAMARHPALDPKRIVVLGHSEGGQFIPLILTERPDVRAGMMLAPPFHTMTIVLRKQAERVRWAFAKAGNPKRAESDGNALFMAAEELSHIEKGVHLGDPVLGQPPGLWASWIELAKQAPELARSMHRPLLILGGKYDYNVEPDEIAGWADCLSGAPAGLHRVRVLDCVTHALNCITQPDPLLIRPEDIGRNVDQAVLDEMTQFLKRVLPQGESLTIKPPTPEGTGKAPPPKSGAP